MNTCTSLSTATYTTTSVVPAGSSNVFLTSRSVSTGHSVLTLPGLLSSQDPSRLPKAASPSANAESSKSGRSKPMPSSTGSTWYLYSEAPYGTTIVGALQGASAAVPSDPTVDRANMIVTGSKTRLTNRDLSFMVSSQRGFRRDDVRATSGDLSARPRRRQMPRSARGAVLSECGTAPSAPSYVLPRGSRRHLQCCVLQTTAPADEFSRRERPPQCRYIPCAWMRS